MLKAKKSYVVIVGCGRLGSFLANSLSREGYSVVVIDKSEEAFEALTAEYSGFRIEGNATEAAVLRQAKIDKADIVIATTHDDNLNLMVAQVAMEIFNVKKVIARVFDPKRERIYKEIGIDTVCPTIISGNAFLRTILNQETLSE